MTGHSRSRRPHPTAPEHNHQHSAVCISTRAVFISLERFHLSYTRCTHLSCPYALGRFAAAVCRGTTGLRSSGPPRPGTGLVRWCVVAVVQQEAGHLGTAGAVKMTSMDSPGPRSTVSGHVAQVGAVASLHRAWRPARRPASGCPSGVIACFMNRG